MAVRSRSGDALCFGERAGLLMARQLREEFGTIDRANEALKDYRTLRR